MVSTSKSQGLPVTPTPDALYIGFGKAGSSYLQAYLTLHPNILHTHGGAEYFFLNDEYYDPNYVYADVNAPREEGICVVNSSEAVVRGGIVAHGTDLPKELMAETPYVAMDEDLYYCDPAEVARRIKETVPDGKIIITIRNQVDWLRSYYLMFIDAMAPGDRSFQAFLNTRAGKSALYNGFYDIVIEKYFEIFGRDRVHIMLLEEMGNGDEEPLRGLCNFLGVPYWPYPLERQVFNRGLGNSHGNILRLASIFKGSHRPPVRLVKFFYGRLFKRIIRRFIPWNTVRGLLRKTSRGLMPWDTLSSHDKACIGAFYSVSNHLTGRLLGKDLAGLGYPT